MLKYLDSPIGERIPLMGKEAKGLLLFIMLMESAQVPNIKFLNTRILTLVLDMIGVLLGEKRMPS